MRVLQVIPPSAGRVGGIEAVLGLFRGMEPAPMMTECPEREEVEVSGLVHFHGLWNPGHRSGYQACADLGVPWVVSPHGMLEPWAWRHRWWKKWPYYWLVERDHLQGAAALHATSEMERGHLAARFPGQRIEVIEPCVGEPMEPDYAGARKRLGWGEELVVLYLSRVDRKKGLRLLVEALGPLVPLVRGKVRLVVVGGGDAGYGRRCRCRAERLGLWADWVGPVWGRERWDYLRGADLFCLPTFSENFGVAVLEALQVGTRVVTTTGTPWGGFGVPEGLVVVEPEVGEVRAGLSAWLDGVVWGEGERAELSRWAHERFSREGAMAAWRAFYGSIKR